MELNPFSYEFHEDPYLTYRRLRDEAPLYRNDELDFYALTRYDDVLAASLDWATYSSAEGTTVERLDPALFDEMPLMIFTDPPRHDRLRALVSRAFTPRRISGLEPFIRSTARSLLEPLAGRGGGDFVKEFSALLPMEVIFTLLGVPADDRRQMREWMDLSLERDPDTPVVPSRALHAMARSTEYWTRFVSVLRQRRRDGLVSALLDAEVDGEHLTDGEIMGLCMLLGSAGNETVTKLLANACVLFAHHPDQYERLGGGSDAVRGGVEEVLRYTSPSQYQGRTVMHEVEWYGEGVPKGSRVLLVTGSANRDEREFPDPDRFDIERPSHISLGFGHGVHFCLGASLARLESAVALEEFSTTFPDYTVDEGSCVRVHMSNVHGYESVPFVAA